MYKVYMRAMSVEYLMAEFETEQEAVDFCEAYGWEVKDENEFVWDMDIDEE